MMSKMIPHLPTSLLWMLVCLAPNPCGAQERNESSSAEDAPSEYPKHPLTQKAKNYYNAGNYNNAAGTFLSLAKVFPENAAVYRAMARSYSWASEPKKALVAYWYYLDLSPDAADRQKVEAEIELLTRRVKKIPSKTPPPKITKAFRTLEVRVKAGQFTGRDGAIGVLEQILESDYVSPKVGQARRQIKQHLETHSNRALEHWWVVPNQVETATLTELTSAWELMTTWQLKASQTILMAALDGLTHLALNEPKKAAKILSPIAPGMPRLRFAQAVALMRDGQYRDARQLLETLAQGAASARVHLLLGFAQRSTNQKAANASFINALTHEDEP
jgi:Tfp pilus assembly protein PilF